jgi:uncharacterized CHY-type Zn-finger protein
MQKYTFSLKLQIFRADFLEIRSDFSKNENAKIQKCGNDLSTNPVRHFPLCQQIQETAVICLKMLTQITQIASKLRFCQKIGDGFSKKCALQRKAKSLKINVGSFAQPPIRYPAETEQRPSRVRESGF